MPFENPTGRSRSRWRRYVNDRSGNIALMFAIVLVPLISLVGAAVDYTRASRARTTLQAALDSAALMVSRDLANGTITTQQLAAKAEAYFRALYTDADATNITVNTTYTQKNSGGASTVSMMGSGVMPTEFMRVAGFPTLNFNSASTATWGGSRMRVALALDVTGSMADAGKMPAMQKAAKSLIDTLATSAKTADDVYVSIVPFAQMVNAGSGNKNAAWLKWDDWEKSNGPNHNKWTGCVTDRDQPADTTDASPTSSSTQYPAAQYNACPSQILGMTSLYPKTNADPIKSKIDSLSPNGGTNQAIGMAWAWTSLLPGDPLAAPAKDANFKYNDAIILLSDGLNTIDRWYGNGHDPSPEVDARQRLLCDNIKKVRADGTSTQIFTIQVNTDGDPESAVLKYCANPGNFYPTSSASGIAGAFDAIGVSLSKLRVAY